MSEQRLTLKQTVAPAYAPITVAEFKEHCRLDVTLDLESSDYFDSLIAAATDYCQIVTRRQFVKATYRLTLDRFPIGLNNDPVSSAIRGYDLVLPRPNLLAVTAINYVDDNGDSQVMTASDYVVSTDDTPGRISLAYNASWPTTRDQVNAVNIVYTAGYLDSAVEADLQAAIPCPVKMAIKLLCAHWYEHREAQMVNAIPSTLGFAVENLLNSQKCTEMW